MANETGGKVGRPRKTEPATESNGRGYETFEIKQDSPDSVPVPLPKLKKCPSCDGTAEVFQDRNKLYRCACKSCGFWDSVPHYDPLAAANSWNAAGGPNPIE